MSISATQQKLLDDLLAKFKQAAGDNLDSVVLYGSAAAETNGFHPEFSDLNVLCLVKQLDTAALQRLAPVVSWWEKQEQPAPMLFTIEELRHSADVFAIELYDIKNVHRVLFGTDHFSTLEVPMNLHRVAVERELRTNLIRLRQRFMAASANDGKAVLQLMTDSVSSFVTLFRHALIALGQQPPERKRDVVDKLAASLGFDRSAFDSILDLREGKLKKDQINVSSVFEGYLNSIQRVVEEVDRRLA
jgi:predicted nucleotidyltransferase